MNAFRSASGIAAIAGLLIAACSSEAPVAAPAAAAMEATPDGATPPERDARTLVAESPTAMADTRDDEPVVLALLGWWTREEIRSELRLSEAQVKEFSAQLRNLELSYQLAHTRLRDARQAQARQIEDARTPSAQILAFHREHMQTLSTETLELNIRARLWVRDHLTAAQMAAVLKRWPGFFRARWFRPARVEVRQGQVRGTSP